MNQKVFGVRIDKYDMRGEFEIQNVVQLKKIIIIIIK